MRECMSCVCVKEEASLGKEEGGACLEEEGSPWLLVLVVRGLNVPVSCVCMCLLDRRESQKNIIEEARRARTTDKGQKGNMGEGGIPMS